jgi:cytoskeleton protein RodZ
LVAIGLVYFIQKTVGKYEKEHQVAETQKSVLIGSQDTTTETNQPTDKASSKTSETNTGATITQETSETTPATTEAQTATAITVAAPAVTAPATPAPATPTPATPTPATPTPAIITTKPPTEVKPVVKTETPLPVEAAKPPTETLKKAPQEIIIEALDNVEIRYQKDGEAEKTVRLKPEQILTLRVDYKVDISVNDGGAVSVIRNGRELGVPGSLGKPAKLNYP